MTGPTIDSAGIESQLCEMTIVYGPGGKILAVGRLRVFVSPRVYSRPQYAVFRNNVKSGPFWHRGKVVLMPYAPEEMRYA